MTPEQRLAISKALVEANSEANRAIMEAAKKSNPPE